MRAEEERHAWQGVARLAASQHGVVSRKQLGAHFTRQQVARRVERGMLIPIAPGLWRAATAPATWQQRVMVWCLAGGATTAASHSCAARVWRLHGVAAGAIHVTVPRNRSVRWSSGLQPGGGEALIVHRADIEAAEIVTRDQLPVTTVTRTLVDLARQPEPGALATATDDALRRRLLTLVDLEAARQARTVAGVTHLDRIIDQRRRSGVGDSEWEDRLWHWIVAAGLPPPARQVVVTPPVGYRRPRHGLPGAQGGRRVRRVRVAQHPRALRSRPGPCQRAGHSRLVARERDLDTSRGVCRGHDPPGPPSAGLGSRLMVKTLVPRDGEDPDPGNGETGPETPGVETDG
jgi:hypothetical protein